MNPVTSFLKTAATSAALVAGLAGSVDAANVVVASDISVSTTWTKDNVYRMIGQIYVLPGATLTIEAGTVIASPTNVGGSLAVAKGAQIMILGTEDEPVIMTSAADEATWDFKPLGLQKNSKSGFWREGVNEWGNLTIMGDAYISEDATVGNTPVPSAGNTAAMEGLIADFPGDTKVIYGGGNDNDDSGSINYLSLRYGGRVIGLNNELNGLSLGGIGRATDIHHLEIMNNVDDGVEIWGGTVNLREIAIWNIGDDSFDIDQGWRGKAQNILIVQGHSTDASQGSGVGDNAFETDGAEDSDWQPVTTATIYNATVIGQPIDGDGLTTWRDNARVQYRNCIFMDCGEQVVRFDGDDGDGASGYGHNGTLSWAQTWTTDYNAVPAHANDFTTGTYATNYPVQTSGKLAEITDSVFFRNFNGAAYTEANNVGVFNASNNNVIIPGFAAEDGPVRRLVRGPAVTKGGKLLLPVVKLDPRPINEAATSVAAAPNDGFFKSQPYRGAFHPTRKPWIVGWTAADAFGFLDVDVSTPGRKAAPMGNPAGTGGTGPQSSGGSLQTNNILQ